MVRTGLETGTKKIPLCWNKFSSTSADSYQALIRIYFHSCSLLSESSADCRGIEKLSFLSQPCNMTSGHRFPPPPGPTVPELKQRKCSVVGREGFLSMGQKPGGSLQELPYSMFLITVGEIISVSLIPVSADSILFFTVMVQLIKECKIRAVGLCLFFCFKD